MTRYLCIDVSHVRDGELHPVDVTSQVRLERDLTPRPMVYVTTTDHVADGIASLDVFEQDGGKAAVRYILTGTSTPLDLPVVVVPERSILFHRPGLHEVDELRRTEPAIDHLFPPREPATDVVVVDTPGGSGSATSPTAQPATAQATATQTTQRIDLETAPQGVYDVWDLTERLTEAIGSRGRALDVLRDAPATSLAPGVADAPWRVVITCPQPEGDPPVHHETVFTGNGVPEAHVVEGTRADGLDIVLERDADRDLAPGAELARTERRLATLLGSVVVVTLLLLAGAWITGALATAARETPGWLAFGVTLVAASVAFGVITLMGPKDPAGNVNDTYTVRRFYSSRMQLLQIAMAIVLGLAALGYLAAIVPPVVAAERPHPAAEIAFETNAQGVEATVTVRADGLASGTEVRIVMRSFDSSTDDGRTIGTVSATSDPDGVVEMRDEVAVSSLARYLAVQVLIADEAIGVCSPDAVTQPGCTVVAVPQIVPETGAEEATTIVVPNPAVPSVAPSPSPVASVVTPTPSATVTTTLPTSTP